MLTGCGGSGAHLANAANLAEEELDQGEELATALPQKMEVNLVQDRRPKQADATLNLVLVSHV